MIKGYFPGYFKWNINNIYPKKGATQTFDEDRGRKQVKNCERIAVYLMLHKSYMRRAKSKQSVAKNLKEEKHFYKNSHLFIRIAPLQIRLSSCFSAAEFSELLFYS